MVTLPHSSSFRALIPFLFFLALFIGTDLVHHTGVEYAFYQLPTPIATLPALIIALILRDSIN